MRLTALLCLLCAAGAEAQFQRPQLVWEGTVDGSVVLRVRADRVLSDIRMGLPIQGQRWRFFERLPEARQPVEVRARDSRGEVRVLEQPRLENQYTLSVLIDDRQPGSGFYLLEFYWQTGPTDREPGDSFRRGPPVRGSSVTWSGRVDGEIVVGCRAAGCASKVLNGGEVIRERFRFTDPLPARVVAVEVAERDGRGEVRLLEQPGQGNEYTAVVLVRDPDSGSGEYRFTLAWQGGSAQEPLEPRRGMIWRGGVDGRVRVTVQGRDARAEALSGAAVFGDQGTFERDLPARENFAAAVRKRRGRGRVELIDYPSARNGYRLVFEIHDPDGGSDQYEVEVRW
ncbi:MAG: hypothetical protein SFV54_21570 [Bryobacteraceae bacterium]|nr:hypothetical protein [Bryobacteraceae bacterium]